MQQAPIRHLRRHRPFGALLLALATVLDPALAAFAQSPMRTVAIGQFVEHPELDNVRRGVIDGLAKAGFDEQHLHLVFESAQGDFPTAVQIAQRFAGMKPDLIVTIGNPMAQAAVRNNAGVPVVFAAVADPLGAGIVSNAAHPGGSVTGVSSFTPVEPQLDLIARLAPQARRIGILGNPAETNSRAVIEAFEKAGAQRGYGFVLQDVMATSEIAASAGNLVGRADVFYVPTDNTVVSGIDAVIKIATGNKIPLFTAETSSVAKGALASAGLDWHQTGVDAGGIAARVLKGEKPGDIAVMKQTGGTRIRVNAQTARALGLALPADLAAQGAEVVAP
jgi:putative ABC transport system substrate-binding protein